jgi:cytochrome c-type biogenesis protein CcmH
MNKFYVALMFLFCWPALALTVETPLADGVQEARARALFHEIRCVVCAGEPVADSRAEVARDVRRLIRERVAAGDGDEMIKAFLVARYGDSILMTPPLKPATYLLWFGPLLIVILAMGLVFYYFHRPRRL